MPHHDEYAFSIHSHSSEDLTINMPIDGPHLIVNTGGTTVDISPDGSMVVTGGANFALKFSEMAYILEAPKITV